MNVPAARRMRGRLLVLAFRTRLGKRALAWFLLRGRRWPD